MRQIPAELGDAFGRHRPLVISAQNRTGLGFDYDKLSTSF